LIQLYNKRNDQLVKIKNKIENSQIEIDNNTPENICAYIDLGFSVVCKNVTKLQKNFFNFDFGEVTQYLRTTGLDFSISRIGASYVISIGTITASDGQGKSVMLKSGLQNFIEIMMDGSVKSRIVISCNIDTSHADITSAYHINRIFEKIYNIVFGEDFSKAYLYAHKYERLTVLKQFTPICSVFDTNEEKEQYLQNHRTRYGGNLIVDGTRLPKNDYILIDKSYFDTYKIKYNNQNLIYELFYSYLFNLGYIDLP
jgi:hypothetical protein